MQIWYQSMTEINRYPAYREALEAHAAEVLPGEARAEVHGVRQGTYGEYAPIELLTIPYAYHVLLEQILDNLRQAQERNFDAFVIGSYSEPFLREARSLSAIPICSMAESSLLVACSYGHGLGLVTINPTFAYMTKRVVEKHGLAGRLVGIEAVTPAVTEDVLADAFDDPEELVDRFTGTAAQLVESGADVIIPAEGVLNEFLYRNRIRRLGNVPVLDVVAVTLLYAHMQVRLGQVSGLEVGRRWEYPSLDGGQLATVEEFREQS